MHRIALLQGHLCGKPGWQEAAEGEWGPHLLGRARADDEVGPCAGDVVPSIKPWQGDLPVDEVGVVEDVTRHVVVVELLGCEHNGDLGVVQLGQDLGVEVLVADHVGVEDHHQLQPYLWDQSSGRLYLGLLKFGAEGHRCQDSVWMSGIVVEVIFLMRVQEVALWLWQLTSA